MSLPFSPPPFSQSRSNSELFRSTPPLILFFLRDFFPPSLTKKQLLYFIWSIHSPLRPFPERKEHMTAKLPPPDPGTFTQFLVWCLPLFVLHVTPRPQRGYSTTHNGRWTTTTPVFSAPPTSVIGYNFFFFFFLPVASFLPPWPAFPWDCKISATGLFGKVARPSLGPVTVPPLGLLFPPTFTTRSEGFRVNPHTLTCRFSVLLTRTYFLL